MISLFGFVILKQGEFKQMNADMENLKYYQ